MVLLVEVLVRGSVGGVEVRFRLLGSWLVRTGAGVSDGGLLLRVVSTCVLRDLICLFTYVSKSCC